MPAPPRLRQLRRDNNVYSLLMNTVRLNLEADERTARHPHLRDAPDAELRHLQEVARRWMVLAAGYVMRRHRCSPEVAVRLVQELEMELRHDTPEAELRAVPLEEVLVIPDELLPPALRSGAAPSPPFAAPAP